MDSRNYSTLTPIRSAEARGISRGLIGFCLGIIVMFWSVAYAKMPVPVADALSRFNIPVSSVSAWVMEISASEPLLAHQATVPRNPASVMKLLTTFAALEMLGPAHTWDTQYFINGDLKDGVLDGDLVIKGGGDPYLVKEQFWLHLVALRELGLKTIKGSLLIDRSRYDLPHFDAAAFDKQPTRLYNVGPAATIVNFNASRFRLNPSDTAVKVSLDPPLPNIQIDNRLVREAGKCRGAKDGWSMSTTQTKGSARVSFKGRYRGACGAYDLERSVLDADAYLYGLFSHLWHSLGGSFEGGYAHAEVKETAEAFYVGSGKTLAEVITGANKYSNNLLARQLLLSLGYQAAGAGATVYDGIDAIRAWLIQKDFYFPELVIKNGAGLSRNSLISAQNLGNLLREASNSEYQPEFFASFSLGGIDGTMKKRQPDLQLGGRARLKTGYLKGVRSLAGYIRSSQGVDYALVFFIDHPRVNFSNGNVIQDAFIDWLLKQD